MHVKSKPPEDIVLARESERERRGERGHEKGQGGHLCLCLFPFGVFFLLHMNNHKTVTEAERSRTTRQSVFEDGSSLR